MSNVRQRKAALATLAMYFSEKNEILSQQDYIDSPDKPIPFSGIRNVFRAYSRMIVMLHTEQPELLSMIEKKKEKLAAPKPVTPIAPKPAIKAAVRPAIKPAVREAKDE